MKGGDRYMEVISVAFPKRSCLRQMGHLRPKMVHSQNSTVRIVLQGCTMKGAKRDMESYINGFFGLKIMCPYNFRSAGVFFNFAQ